MALSGKGVKKGDGTVLREDAVLSGVCIGGIRRLNHEIESIMQVDNQM